MLLVGLGRVVQDLLLWCTVEFGYLRLADGFVQCSSIMPQKRNPVALEHARAIASKALGQAQAIVTAVHNTPFGDIVDTEDDLQPLVASMFRDAHARRDAGGRGDARRRVRRRSGWPRARGDGGTTLTELADTWCATTACRSATAHAHRGAAAAGAGRGSRRVAVARAADGVARRARRAARTTRTRSCAQILSPQHFVEVRTTPGGPAPARDGARRSTASRRQLARRATALADAQRRERRLADRGGALARAASDRL